VKKYLLFLLFISSGIQQVKSQETIYPDRIMLTIPGNPATSRAVSWRSAFEDTISLGEITITDPAPTLEKSKTTVTGTFSPWEEGSKMAMGHKVIFENLKPDTKYAYRVGNVNNWSEWFQFKTSSDKVKPFSFLYFGDVQNDIKPYGSRILRQGYSHFPESDFMLFAGDLVKVSNEEYWSEFFYAGGWIFSMIPSLPTPGNHEYDKQENQSRTFSKHWNQIFTLPFNGPSEKFRNRVYFLDYQGVRFISIDSPAYGENDEDDELILGWLDKTLANNPNRWAVVLTHYPVYYCCQGRDKKEYQDAGKAILEKYGVDIVLQGHDHTYCRGQNLPNASANSTNHPMYVVSVAGEKMYGLNSSFWSDRVASNTQLYQHITFNDNTMSFKSYTVTGDLYDDFELRKNKAGINRVVVSRKVSGILQHTEIPEGEEGEYSKEEMQKYQQKFQKSKPVLP
jgi:3',5'-cyclic AMP phosphodiesterase CpdA